MKKPPGETPLEPAISGKPPSKENVPVIADTHSQDADRHRGIKHPVSKK